MLSVLCAECVVCECVLCTCMCACACVCVFGGGGGGCLTNHEVFPLPSLMVRVSTLAIPD